MVQKPHLFLFFILFNVAFTFSQNISGIVKENETKAPLSGVHITSKSIRSNTITTESGEFQIRLKDGFTSVDSISFSSMGYQTIRISPSDLKLEIEVLMTPTIDELREVDLSADRKFQKRIRFSRLSSMKRGAYDFGSTVVGAKIYVIGGDASRIEEPIKIEMARSLQDRSISDILNSAQPNFSQSEYLKEIQVYDIVKDEWTVLSLTVSRRAGHNVVFHNNRIYIFGGKKLQNSKEKVLLTNDIEILDLKKDTVLLDPINPHQAVKATAFVYNDGLLVMGGSVRVNKRGKKIFTDEIHLFNFKSGLWFNAGKMLISKEPNGAIVGEKIFLIGGNDGNWLTTIESVDLSSGKWKKEGKLSSALKDPSVVSHKNLIYVYEKGKIHVFDTVVMEMKTYLLDLDLHGANLHIFKNHLYLLGGYKQHGYTTTPSGDVFKIELEEFDKTEVNEREFLSKSH